jgi:hypothetical protein
MKKVFSLVLGIVLLFAANSWAAQGQEFLRTSTVKTASALIYTGQVQFAGIVVATDGANAVTLDVCDATTNACASKVIPQTVIPTSATNRSWALSIDPAVLCHSGIYIVISTNGTASYTVYYK